MYPDLFRIDNEGIGIVGTLCQQSDIYKDLVFYNYLLKCFVLIDLKTTKVDYQDAGQMKMYVSMYDEKYRTEGDNPTIGILLCADTDEDVARYSSLHDDDQLYMAKYLTYMPTQDELVERIFFTTAELWGSAVRRFMIVYIMDGKVEDNVKVRVHSGRPLQGFVVQIQHYFAIISKRCKFALHDNLKKVLC